MLHKLSEKYHYSFVLLKELVKTDFKLRYQGSVLGYVWSLLRPLLLFLILYMVFVRFLKIGSDIPHYPIYLLMGIVFWNFFSDMTTQGLASIVARGDLIKKIRLPRIIIVSSVSISALINFTLNLLVVAGFVVVNDVQPTAKLAWIVPLIVEVYVLALGVALFLSALYVKYRDVSYVWELILQAGFYITPVIYPMKYVVENLSIEASKIMILNPIAQIIQDVRYVLLGKDSVTISTIYANSLIRLVPLALVLGIFMVGVLYFRRESKLFAENL